jgi:2-polyprenyl-3-methyl-5-hydroxy-6-metoxy-1,4-benzoquinol methylase
MNEDLVRAAFRVLLGREPENPHVIAEITKDTDGDAERILASFSNSIEFKTRYLGFLDVISDGYAFPRRAVDTEVSQDVLEKIFMRIKEQWTKLGNSEPFYSVLTNNKFKSQNFQTNLNEFYESGRSICAMVDYFAARNGVTLTRGACIELGSGVGRVTRHLADRFDEVIAVDISEGNLRECRSYMQREGVKNVNYYLLTSPRDIENLPAASFFYSIIVLQHNPPPIQRYFLDIILSKLQRSACCLFQTPTNGINYGFDANCYLQSEVPEMEVHCLPMHVIFSLFEKHGLTVKEVAMDSFTGAYGSHTFFAQKR